jgi:FkbM family methyltransferase
MELRTLATYLPSPLLHLAKRVHYQHTFANSTLADEPDLALLPELIEPDFACLDIGANLGIYSKHLSALSANVLAFEPIRETFGYLANNVRDLPNVTIQNAAVSDRLGTVTMEIPNIYEARITGESGDIPCLTIDSLNLDRCDFIKCDVEGHELSVVKGALRTISRHKPMWLIESNWDSQLFSTMQMLGYQCFIEDRGSLRPRLDGERKTNYWFVDKA